MVFYFHQLTSLQQQLNLTATHGGIFTNLTTTGFGAFQVAFPSNIEEQRAFATALSDVDALLSVQDKLIAKKRDIKQAAMQQLLTGKQRLPGFSGEWEVKTLGDLFTLSGGYPSPLSQSKPPSPPCSPTWMPKSPRWKSNKTKPAPSSKA